LKIAINAWFYNQINTGSGQYLRYLVHALADLTPELEIVLVAPEFTLTDEGVGWPESVKIYSAPIKKPGNLAKVRFEQGYFPVIAQQLEADVAHVPYFGSPLSNRIPTVVTVHDLIPLVLPEYRGGPLVRLYTSLVGAAAANADLVLADSEASRQDILTHLKLSPDKVRAVYLAPAPHFKPAKTWDQIEYVTKKYNLPEVFALYMGGFDARKNLKALLHAWTFVAGGLGNEVKLVLAGNLPKTDSAFFPDPLKMAKELGIAEHIVTPGWIDEEDKPALYSAARLFVYPSRYEGFGLPTLEAMACGAPVVTTNAASLPELVGSAAFQVDPDDTKGLAAPIISLTIQENTHNEMANKGYQQAMQFTWQKTAAQTLQAYNAQTLQAYKDILGMVQNRLEAT